MASESVNVPTGPSSDSPSRSRSDGPRGGRGRERGRGRGGGFGNDAPGPDGRQGGARRGGRGGHNARGGHTATEANTMTAGDLAAKFQKKPMPKVEKAEGEEGEGDEEDVEAEVCFICASLVVHNAVAPCNHRTCHICALRMRALYKTKDCAHCRTPAMFVIFTDDATKRYQDFSEEDIASTDENIGIRYENNDIREDTRLLLRYNCPDADCDVACLGWPDLHRHVRTIHHKKICDLCSRHKKVFTHEHELFTDKQLSQHMKKGDDNPGAIDQSGFKGHPLCGFCGQRFYGDDELYVHCRETHERCFICDAAGGPPTYYVNYDSLWQHYKKEHFPCMDRECLEKKLIVFPTELDLKAHQLEEHGNTLSKDVRRDARVVDMSNFDYRAPYVAERRGGGSQREQREGRGRGRGRDPNAEPIPQSSAQPLRRDEQAFQRQMAIHSAQSVTTRTFGGQLTAGPTPAAASRPSQPAGMTVPQPSANSEALTTAVANMNVSQADLTPQEQARQLRHREVIDRATTLLQNDQTKLTQFRNSISSFKKNSITATALIDSFFALFSDTSSTALGTLIREVADLYEDKTKADSLRTAWNDWRAINEDYPSLPGPGSMNTSLPLGWASVTSNSSSSASPSKAKSSRVLKLKSSTAQSSRSSVSQTSSWATSSGVASSSNPFPGLPPLPNRATASSKVTTTPWVAPSSAPNSGPSSARPTPPTSRPASRGPVRNVGGSDVFPALPPAAKPQSTIFGYGTGMVRRDAGRGAASGFSWGASANRSAEQSAAASENENTEEGAKGKKKGKKGKKQVLMNWG